jgi:uncharacterized protein (TIGR00288 family)
MNETYTRAPHRRLAPTEGLSPHAALLIDFDNVTMGIRSNLGAELRKLLDSDIIRGKVSVQRAYADWRRYPQYIVPLSEAAIDLIFAPAYGSTKKNATDIRLAIDALEIVFTRPEIGTFILLSGDSDFSSLVLKLKEYGKYVIGVGLQESSSDLLVQNCDEYYSYNTLSGLTSAADVKTEKHDPWELAAKAIDRMVERRDVMRSDRFKQVMLELDQSFSEKSQGFSKFNRFLTEAASRGILTLQKAPNGQYEVAPGPRRREYLERPAAARGAPAQAPATAPSPPGGASVPDVPVEEPKPRTEARRSRSRSRRTASAASIVPAEFEPPEVDEDRLRAAYDLLRGVVGDLSEAGRSVRDSEVKRAMLERDASFDEAALGFRKFNRFLRQAHDEEVIDLRRGAEGNYLVGPPGQAAEAEAERKESKRRERKEPRSRGKRDREPEVTPPEVTPPEVTAPELAAEGIPGGSQPVMAEEQRRPSLGRFRRGARSRPTGPKGDGIARPAIGPVDEVDEVAEPKSPASAQERVEQPPVESGEATGPPSLGRFRRGSRSGSGADGPAVHTRMPVEGEPEAEELEAAAGRSSLTPEQRGTVNRMARSYTGVGRRTAEKLVSEFGDEVFEVIDNAPGRLSKILPERLVRAVLDGRKSELAEGEEAEA